MKKILIANRGEIALRVMRSAREMGIKTVAVYSEADRNALHVRYADEAVLIGPAPSNQSYLVIEKIIDAARQTGADGIHPGYGFLSENPLFARKVKQGGITFIGPSAEAMEMMGSKLAAKAMAEKHNIPLVPGTAKAIEDMAEARNIADKIGFPVLIKASAGGGGKGMRMVEERSQFEEQMKRAQSEALSAFGDGSVFIEKYVASPRHIEIQVLGDTHGKVVHFFERECSIQRRHQKVVEEAPSSVLTPQIRKEMGRCAVEIAKACKYSGAGTVEFLLDENKNFYFLEMNTRLQVEHPVTEFITGIDLVKEQIKIARGEKLSFRQEDLSINGHAIEIRVCAEDPANNFLPDTGTLTTYKIPQGRGVRVDDGFEEGMDIPIFYDPMIAKLIVYGKDRREAIDKMIRAIDEYKITGVETTLSFCRFVMQHEAFVSGNFDTHFVQLHFKPEMLKAYNEDEAMVAAFVALETVSRKKAVAHVATTAHRFLNGKLTGMWNKGADVRMCPDSHRDADVLIWRSSVIVIAFLFCSSLLAQAQDTTLNPIKVPAIIIDGDTVPYMALPNVVITGAMDPETMKKLQEYYRLRFNVFKMYPYARLAAVKLKEINDGMAALDNKHDKKKYLKESEKQLKKDFEETVKNFSEKQGDVLIKLIDRETGNTSYELVKELRGSFNAFIWQTAARLFGHNLKDVYDPQGEDRNIEAIVKQIEAGQTN